jgi:hypothetical protein
MTLTLADISFETEKVSRHPATTYISASTNLTIGVLYSGAEGAEYSEMTRGSSGLAPQ